MGFLSGLLGAAAPIVGSIFGGPVGGAIGGALGGALSSKGSSQPSGTTTTTTQQTLDPRISSMLFGQGGADSGLLGTYKGMLNTPQNGGINTFGRERDQYVGYQGSQDLGTIRDKALQQMQGGILTPTVQAPKQNDMDLTGSFNSLINGAPGSNPFLTKGIQSGIDMSKAGFKQQQDDSTRNLMQTILPSIRSNSVLAGQYGGSRQGIAEGNAIGDFQKEQQRSLTNFGLGNTQAAVGAQSQAYDADRNRQLAATMGLSGQQYGSALANNQAALQTNQLNANQQQSGIGNLSGLVNGAVGAAQNQDAYGVNHAQQVNGLLSPYLSANSGSTSSQPLYQNQGGSLLGGAAAGLGLANQLSGTKAKTNGGSTDWLGQMVGWGGPNGTL